MISDQNLQIASSQAFTNGVGTSVVTEDSVDVGGVAITPMTGGVAVGDPLPRDLGEGEPLYLIFTNTGGATFTGATTVRFEIITSAAAALTSPTVLIKTEEIPVASMVAGKQVVIRLQLDPADKTSTLQRYLGGQLTATGGGTLANATVDCHIVQGNQAGGMKHYPSSIVVPNS